MSRKTAVITGASSGIGAACAKAFAQESYNLVLAARSTNDLEAIAAECEKLGVQAVPVKTDVSEEEDCKNLISAALEHFGRIDVLVNNAGISMRAAFEDTELEVLRKLMDVNFWGTVYCTKHALPHLLKQKGSLIGISSIAGFIGLPGRTGYSASKFAMNGFLETVRAETLHSGLHVLIVAPGFTASRIREKALTASGSSQAESPRKEEKMMQPEEVAARLLKAVKSRKSQLVLTSEGKLTVLLNKFFPGFITRMAHKKMANEPDSPLK